MFKKFLHGLVFGAGFGIAFFAVWIIGIKYLLPKALETATNEPEFLNPKVAEIAEPESDATSAKSRKYSFFKNSEYRMAIPENGGILSMSPMATPDDSKKPYTYQLWLTETELWQIRTADDNVEVEMLSYPEGASVKTLDNLMFQSLGTASRQSTMTISEYEIQNIKTGQESMRNSSLNGILQITVEGVVFILPNDYET